jgi:hypothetical protein
LRDTVALEILIEAIHSRQGLRTAHDFYHLPR